MKKLVSIIICFAIMLSLVSCKKNEDNLSVVSTNTDIDTTVSAKSDIEENSSEEASTENTDTSDESVVSPTSSKEETSSKTESKPSSSETSGSSLPSESKPPVVSEEIDASTEEKIEEQLPGGIVGDDTQTEGSDLVLGEDYGAFAYEGNFLTYALDSNVMYTVFKNPNSITAYDAKNLDMVYSYPLPGRPAEIQIDGGNLLISYPDLKCIRVYDKNNFSQINSISLPNVVSSFCIDGNVVYYAEDDQHCKVFCTNLQTNETTAILNDGKFPKTFSEPKLLLNKKLGLLYIGESGSTGSALYYYNTADLSMHSVYKKDNYGLSNWHRTMYFVNDNVFWGGFRFGADSAENVIGEYSGYSFYHADENFVVTPKGVFDTNTYMFLSDLENMSYVFVTKNKALVAVFRINPANIVVIVPYDISIT